MGDGNWFNEYDHDGIEYDDVPPDTVTISDKETPLKKNKKNVSFEKSDGPKEKPVSKSGKSPRERWQWAFTRIVQEKSGAAQAGRPGPDNPFFKDIDSMPEFRPRRKSIPLVSELTMA